jgi:hypothetical protein
MPLWREEVLNRAADRLIAQFTQPALPPVKTGKMTEKAKRRMQKRLQKRRQKRSTT